MATLKIKIQPFEIPEHVYIEVPGDAAPVAVALGELDEDTLSTMIEEFVAGIMAKTGRE